MPGLRVEVTGDVALVVLDQPDRRNALTLELVGQMVDTFDHLEAGGDVGAVVLTGEPPAFCAGADLSHLGETEEEGLRAIYEGFLRVGRSPLPTVAAVNGPAVGAGVNLALACDVRLAGRSAVFDTRFLQLGLHPGGGHTWMLHQLCGPQVAAAMVLFGDALDGEAAERCGLVWRCVDDEALLDHAHSLALRATEAPPELVRRMKATLRQASALVTHQEAVELELEAQVWSLHQPGFAERLVELRRHLRSE